jgi:hypothetical protein
MIKDVAEGNANIDCFKKATWNNGIQLLLILGKLFSNMVFQNESFESITDLDPLDLPMPKFATCTTFFLQSIEPTPNAPRT